ncbi:flavodoxin domain-containing protein [Candidatus Woesebacteria bacterium]|nr:flavodoxin domain-containing protein [Candidatus Woesebacteria bacterium]MCD8507447.1 flavodoxin domain-containing protein [Candidatus Woesebacteria bacterium]MCD8526861.1 flavodoxin domain-containing protein [Candidatus Woesebacteria bacterium]MCD8545801.1 flavodoxin domain-containing protein [Candidatus Woesebacteria bacterium]
MLQGTEKILVVYASISGSTKRVAEHLQQHLQERLPDAQVDILDMLVANPEAFREYDFVFIGASTYDNGLNPFGEVFVVSLAGREPEQMWSGVNFAVFGLGDSSYLEFCMSPDILKECAESHGGVVHEPLLRIDVLTQEWDEQQAVTGEWADNFIA